RLAIATSSAYSNVKTLLDINLGSDWREMFEVVATCNIIEAKKPSPAVYNYVLQEMRLAPDQCIAFEDTVNGLTAATAAGIKTVVTTHYFTRNHRFPGAALVVNHLGEPDHPFRRLAGVHPDVSHVTLGLLKEIIQSGSKSGRTTRFRSPCASSASAL
ncbi:MAG: HAD-IA family hydrolase, partial [Gammaproteobacteria bacterium]|nr:HAD-IA family hydrolase [Gammaproteobacteria bacterium]